MSWDIVLWKNENQVSYVPSCWANAPKTLYKFPTSKNQLLVRRYIHDCEDLKNDFTWCAADPKKLNVNSFKEARKLCEKAEYTSNLDSNDEDDNVEISKFGRKRKKRMISTSDSEVSTTSIVDYEYKDVLGSTIVEKKPKLIQSIQPGTKGKNVHLGEDSRNKVSSMTSCSGEIFSQNNSPSKPRPIRLEKSTISSQRMLLTRTRSKSLDMEIEEVPSQPFQESNATTNAETNAKIYRQVIEVKFEIKEISQKLANMEHLLQNFIASAVVNNTETDIVPNLLENLPLDSENDITSFNNQIATNKNSFKKLVQLLYLIGGETPKKIVYGQMSKLLTNEVCNEYSGHGKLKKKAFTALKLFDAIVESTRKRLPAIPENEIKKLVGLFLTTYKSRIKKPLLENSVNNGNEETDH